MTQDLGTLTIVPRKNPVGKNLVTMKNQQREYQPRRKLVNNAKLIKSKSLVRMSAQLRWVAIDFNNVNGTRTNMVLKMMPFNGQMMLMHTGQRNRISGNGKTCSIRDL